MESEGLKRIRQLTEFVQANQGPLAYFAGVCLSTGSRSVRPETIEDVLSDAYLVAATRIQKDPDLAIRKMGAWFRKVIFFTCLKEKHKRKMTELTHTSRLSPLRTRRACSIRFVTDWISSRRSAI